MISFLPEERSVLVSNSEWDADRPEALLRRNEVVKCGTDFLSLDCKHCTWFSFYLVNVFIFIQNFFMQKFSHKYSGMIWSYLRMYEVNPWCSPATQRIIQRTILFAFQPRRACVIWSTELWETAHREVPNTLLDSNWFPPTCYIIAFIRVSAVKRPVTQRATNESNQREHYQRV